MFDVAGKPDAVAKVYLKAPSAQRAAKLSAMAGMASAPLLRIAAWPTGTLHEPSGSVAGFMMPKVGGHEPVFKLYGPKLRMQEFPTADWRFLIHAAANAARSFSTVHAAGLVIGDVNHGNLVVGQDATVRMIDCDSFQVTQAGKTWFCEVGVGTHQPPEMQALDSYAGVLRTPNHDSFGLAVIVFQLLCIARHPFAGRYKGPGEPPSIEDAIKASRYAYSRDRSRTAMEPPPGSLPVDALTPSIQDLFERAFAPGAARAGRPNADQWVTALGELASDLKSCGANGAHFYRKGLSACPWCAIENASGITLFPVVFKPGAVGATGMAALWQEVSKLPDPPLLGQCPPPPGPAVQASPAAQALAGSGRSLKTAAWGSVAASLAVTLAFASPDFRAAMVPAIGVIAFIIHRIGQNAQQNPFQQRLGELKREWDELRRAWNMPLPGPSASDIRANLTRLKAQYDGLNGERAKRMQKLNEQRREKQLEDHLDHFSLTNAKVPGIGPARVATLASHGIDTASDIISHRLLAVPGFGPATVAKLLAWRRSHEASFRFDPSKGVSSSEIALVERDIAAQRTKLEREVAAGLARMRAAAAAHTSRRQALEGRVAELRPQYAQAAADAAVVPENRTTHKRLLALAGAAAAVALVTGIGHRSPIIEHRPSSAATDLPVTPVVTLPVPLPAPPAPSRSAEAPRPASADRTTPEVKAPKSEQASAPEALAPTRTVTSLPLPPISRPASAASTAGVGERVIMRQAANVRAGASGSSAVVRTAPSGAVLRVFERNAGWVLIGEEDPWGWVFSGLMEPAP
ncbi:MULTISPECIES: SH3 domain-containing protein [Roseomonadaceae]|uniref:SH3 domain-containing protein n=1 Tax=Falsiroseomonas oleicola TaxID=2801474 RepID=A0ABS6HF60_9PROT|nr:SH3 domain-containing protein [Roseomonas oleicola]MBU8546131.1 SH3 domain-containing protein [Roseomonas oleicola]